MTRMSRSCVDGPVFDGDRVRWARRRHGCRRTRSGRRRDASPPEPVKLDHARPRWGRCRCRTRCSPRPGCAAAGRELEPFVDVSALGAVVTKSVMLRPRSGRPTPRMAETPSGMLNSIGLQGPGIDAFLAARPALAGRARRPGGRVASPAAASTSSPSWPARLARRARRGRDRGEHLLPERGEPRPGVRLRPVAASPGDRPRSGPSCRPGIPVLAKLSPGRHRHRRGRPGRAPTPAPTGCR